LKMYWVLVVMDQSTRRIIGFAVHAGYVDGIEPHRVCRRPFHLSYAAMAGSSSMA
jgi:hypothetical protein